MLLLLLWLKVMTCEEIELMAIEKQQDQPSRLV